MAGRKLMQEAIPIWSTAPQSWNATPSVGAYISMKGYQSVVFVINTGLIALTPNGLGAVTVNEALTVGGGTPLPLAFTEYWTNEAAIASAHQVRTACVNTFILTTANALYALEITADSLTTNLGYDCISLAIATPGANADFYGAVAFGFRSRYQGNLATTVIDPLIN